MNKNSIKINQAFILKEINGANVQQSSFQRQAGVDLRVQDVGGGGSMAGI